MADSTPPSDGEVNVSLPLRQSELHKNCSAIITSRDQDPSSLLLRSSSDCSWKPFGWYPPLTDGPIRTELGCFQSSVLEFVSSDKKNYKQLLGTMDYSFLCAYAIGMYLR